MDALASSARPLASSARPLASPAKALPAAPTAKALPAAAAQAAPLPSTSCQVGRSLTPPLLPHTSCVCSELPCWGLVHPRPQPQLQEAMPHRTDLLSFMPRRHDGGGFVTVATTLKYTVSCLSGRQLDHGLCLPLPDPSECCKRWPALWHAVLHCGI